MRLTSTCKAIFGITLLWTGLVSPAQSQDDVSSPGILRGIIVDDGSGNPIRGASVLIMESRAFARSLSDGTYAFRDVAPGAYTLRVFKTGYRPTDITEVTILAGETTTLDINLPLQGDTPEESGEIVTDTAPSVEGDAGADQIFQLDAFTVTAEEVQSVDAALLSFRQRSVAVSDAIGEEAFSNLSLGDAAEALRKVPGASVVDNKFVFIRGLGDRYAITLLNGSTIPSADPDRRSVQMDQFPSDLLESIVTTKTFTPDQPGAFSGGAVDIRTKSFPFEFFVSVGGGVSYNTNTTGEEILVSRTGLSFDAMGTDERPTSSVPSSAFPGGSPTAAVEQANLAALRENNLQPAQQLDEAIRSFNNDFYPTTKTAPANTNFDVAFGDSHEFENGQRIGYTANFTWDNSYSHYDGGTSARWSEPDELAESPPVYSADPEILQQVKWFRESIGVFADPYGGDVPYGVTSSTQTIAWGAFAQLSYMPTIDHEISVMFFHNQSAEDQVERGVGDTVRSGLSSDFLIEGISVLYTERAIQSVQLSGKSFFPDFHDLELEWQYADSTSTQDQPDFRTMFTPWDFEEQRIAALGSNTNDFGDEGLPLRRFRELEEGTEEYSIDLTIPVDTGREFKFGGLASDSFRDYKEDIFSTNVPWFSRSFGTGAWEERTLNFDPSILGYDFSLAEERDIDGDGVNETILAPASFNRQNVTAFPGGNNYDGQAEVTAVYAMADWELNDNWRIIGGARYEQTAMSVQQFRQGVSGSNDDGEGFDVTDVLPALHLIYSINFEMQVRAAYGRTIALPSFKELSPIILRDSFTGDAFQGNPALQRTIIDNFDLRWEWFMEDNQLLAVSAFYKEMENPIETLISAGQVGVPGNIVPQNVEEGTVYGIELEGRYQLGRLLEFLENFDLSGNISIIESEVSVPQREVERFGGPDTRSLAGQSGFLANLDLTYSREDWGSNITLSYNFTGERLALVTLGNSFDGIFEKGVHRLKFIWAQDINETWNVKFTADNLTDPTFEQFYDVVGGGERVYESYQRGLTFSFSAGARF